MAHYHACTFDSCQLWDQTGAPQELPRAPQLETEVAGYTDRCHSSRDEGCRRQWVGWLTGMEIGVEQGCAHSGL